VKINWKQKELVSWRVEQLNEKENLNKVKSFLAKIGAKFFNSESKRIFMISESKRFKIFVLKMMTIC
jgi:hypothetical protein